ncbi:MAG: lipopolysaccharide heptosyltransferase II [Pseudomonadota bacterium]|nr:lipopolysaccharide heptosyltransferase II [Pseudomonadota bacterium]MDP1903368.1 lipopolysaccharide heptosyltransferase II [Pseudomonadota bacterium]MDP2352338.1 lipopolysaccharide heptosyltransferase II [Pseudomonadota bacterium]
MSSPKYSILIVGPSWVGDMLMAQSLFKALAAREVGIEAGLELDVLAPAWSHGILARMPEVRRALVAPFTHGSFGLKERWRLGRDLAREGYDQAIVLPNSWKSALVPFFAGIPLRTGYLGEFRHGLLNDKRRLDKQGMPRLVERYADLAFPAWRSADTVGISPTPLLQRGAGGISPTIRPALGPGVPPQPRLAVHPEAQQATLTRLGLNRERRILALCPGAEFGPAKRWPEAHYAAVARAKLEQGWQVWLFGSAKDKAVTDTINHLTGDLCANLAGQTTLEETVDLLACAAAVVSNDSGLMHIAAAVDVPLVAVYGSTDPGYTPPYSDKAQVVRLGLECSPCFKRECPLGHLDCLNKLGAERVLEVMPGCVE